MIVKSQHIPDGYKQTEVGVIPPDWEPEAIGQHVEIMSGESPSLFRFQGDGLPYFKVEQLNCDSKYIIETPYYITNGKFVCRGSLIFPKRGAAILLNKVRILARDSYMDTNLMTLTPKPSIHSEFLYYALSHFGLWRVADTTSIPQINNKHIKPLCLAFPPTLAEQEAIAAALSDADGWIESLEGLIAKKRHLKQAAMQQLLTGKKRLPGFDKEWEVRTLGDIASLFQPITISASKFTDSGVPVYGANGIVGFFSEPNHETWQVTVTCRGSTCGTVNRTVDRCWITGNAMVVNCDGNARVEKEFLYFLLCEQDLSICITGTGQPQIVRSPLASFEVSIPQSTAEQTAIAEFLSDMDAEVAALEAKLTKARQIKQGMMQELLTGRIRLVEPEVVA